MRASPIFKKKASQELSIQELYLTNFELTIDITLGIAFIV